VDTLGLVLSVAVTPASTTERTAVYPDSTEPDKQLLVQRDRSWSEYFFDQGKGNRMAGAGEPYGPGSMVSPNGSTIARPGRTPINGLTRPGSGESARIKARAFTIAMDKMAAWN
jgi:hypothetical protein